MREAGGANLEGVVEGVVLVAVGIVCKKMVHVARFLGYLPVNAVGSDVFYFFVSRKHVLYAARAVLNEAEEEHLTWTGSPLSSDPHLVAVPGLDEVLSVSVNGVEEEVVE